MQRFLFKTHWLIKVNYFLRNDSLKRRMIKLLCACSTLELFVSTAAVRVASVGSSPLVEQSAVVQCQSTDLSGCKALVENNPFVSAILKATVRTSPRDKCVWGSTWETAKATEMQTPIPDGTQCPGL